MEALSINESVREEGVTQIAARLERLPLTTYQLGLLLIIALAWLFDSIDLGSLTFTLTSIRTEFHLGTVQAGFFSSVSFGGMLIGAVLGGLAADRFGRKSLLQVSIIFWGAGSILCSLAPTLEYLTWARLLVGFGMGMEFPIAQAIAAEIAPSKNRARIIALLEGCWCLGFIAAGLITYVVLHYVGTWRTVFLVEGAPALVVLLVRRWLPESPRWLADHGAYKEADDITKEIEANVRRRLSRELPPPKTVEHQSPGQRWLLTIWSGDMRRRTLMLWIVWFSAMFGYYGLTTWIAALLQQSHSVFTSIQYTTIISLGGIPGVLLAAWLIERVERRWLCAALLIGAAVFCYFYGRAADEFSLLIFGGLMQFCLFGMWSVLYAYTPELYPTHARATGAGLASAIGRIGSLTGPSFVGAIVLPHIGSFGVFASGATAFAIAALALVFWGDSTKGKTVEQIAR